MFAINYDPVAQTGELGVGERIKNMAAQASATANRQQTVIHQSKVSHVQLFFLDTDIHSIPQVLKQSIRFFNALYCICLCIGVKLL